MSVALLGPPLHLGLFHLKMWQTGIQLLAWGTSPMLLSHSIAGYPWASGFVSHALALYVIMNRRLHAHWLATACLAFLAIESSWHVYQPSRSLSVVFLAALFLYRRAPIPTRLVWLCAAAVQIIEAAVIHPSPSSTSIIEFPIINGKSLPFKVSYGRCVPKGPHHTWRTRTDRLFCDREQAYRLRRSPASLYPTFLLTLPSIRHLR